MHHHCESVLSLRVSMLTYLKNVNTSLCKETGLHKIFQLAIIFHKAVLSSLKILEISKPYFAFPDSQRAASKSQEIFLTRCSPFFPGNRLKEKKLLGLEKSTSSQPWILGCFHNSLLKKKKTPQWECWPFKQKTFQEWRLLTTLEYHGVGSKSYRPLQKSVIVSHVHDSGIRHSF